MSVRKAAALYSFKWLKYGACYVYVFYHEFFLNEKKKKERKEKGRKEGEKEGRGRGRHLRVCCKALGYNGKPKTQIGFILLFILSLGNIP